MPPVGARVVVPLGPRTLTGCRHRRSRRGADAADAIKPIIEVLDERAVSCRRMSSSCRVGRGVLPAGPGAALAAALPPHGAARAAFKTVRVVRHRHAPARRGLPARPPGRPGQALRCEAGRRADGRRLEAARRPTDCRGARERGVSGATRGEARRAGAGRASRQERVDRDPFEHAVADVDRTTGGRDADRRAAAGARARSLAGERARRSRSRCCTASPAAARPRSTCAWPKRVARAGTAC